MPTNPEVEDWFATSKPPAEAVLRRVREVRAMTSATVFGSIDRPYADPITLEDLKRPASELLERVGEPA